mmetsp:Transcript_29506/g.76197  ORF Transcript_29506/g.76197 Transcript_29506/m.76197 type:complete len:207 (+) Transcript_29506:1673-2293(+)
MADKSTEEVVFHTPLQQVDIERSGGNLLEHFDGALVLLQRCGVVCYLQQALIGRARCLFSGEEIGSSLIRVDRLLQLVLALKYLANILLKLGSRPKFAELGEDAHGLLEADHSLRSGHLLVCIGSVLKSEGSLVWAVHLGALQVGNLHKGISRLLPKLGKLIQICSLLKHLDGLIIFLAKQLEASDLLLSLLHKGIGFCGRGSGHG